ncbi:hypothetical protein ACFE04_004392 [Oxalis oulophora]
MKRCHFVDTLGGATYGKNIGGGAKSSLDTKIWPNDHNIAHVCANLPKVTNLESNMRDGTIPLNRPMCHYIRKKHWEGAKSLRTSTKMKLLWDLKLVLTCANVMI